MKHFRLLTCHTEETIFEGRFTSFIDCLETAIKLRINLSHIDLSHQNLTNANMDEAIMPSADFTGSNLSGANMSEGYFRGANFYNASLYNTCLCYANLSQCNFVNASFGGTDILGTILSSALFSTLSTFTLNFSASKSMQGCIFINPDGTTSNMTQPPIIINGISTQPIIILDKEIRNGHKILNHKRLLPLSGLLAHRTLRQRLGQ